MPDVHSLFFSYRTREAALAQPLLDALAAVGVDVWRDTARTDAGDAITPAVRQALARSRTLLAFYSEAYNDSPVCQWELATAWSAARAGGEPTDRVLLVLPPGRASPRDVHPVGVEHRPEFDTIGFYCPADDAPAEAWRDLARKLKARLDQVDDRTFRELADLAPPRFHLHRPDRSNRFVGRLADLWALDGLLHAGRHATVTNHTDRAVQVIGMGGIGKTQLATEYAWRFASAWPGGVVWVNEARRDRDDVLYDLAPSLDDALGHLTDRDARVAATSRYLEQLDQPYLWVLDNVPGDRNSDPPGLTVDELRQRSAPTAQGVTLVTTRSRAFESFGLAHNVDVLPLQDALVLLTKDRAIGLELADAAALCHEVGFHPLALDVLRGLVAADPELPHPFAHWRERLANPSDDALAAADTLLADEWLPGAYAKNIAVVLQSSLDTLPEAGWDILCAAATLAELPIPSALLEGLLAAASGAPLANGWRVQGVKAAEARSLAKATPEGVVVHALVARVVRRADCRVDRCRQVAPDVMVGLLADVEDVRTHVTVAGVVEHAREWVAGQLDADAARLAGQLAIHDLTRGDYRSARVLYHRALEAFTMLLGHKHPDTLRTLHNLALTLKAQGDFTGARNLEDLALDARAELLGHQHPDTLRTLGSLGGTLQAQGDLRGAREVAERVLETRTTVLGPDHPETLNALLALAGAMFAQGDHIAARNLLERALEARIDILGADHPDTLAAVHDLAITLKAQHDFRGARDLEERVLEARTRFLGPEHPHTLDTGHNLAVTLKALRDLRGARDLEERTLDARTRLLGPEHPDTLATLQNLAITLQAQGDFQGARQIEERALEANTKLLGPEHPNTLTTLHNLANTLHAQGDLRGARERYERALEARSRILGHEHPETRVTRFQLVITLLTLGDARAARPLVTALAAIEAQPEHTLTATDRQIRDDMRGFRDLVAFPTEAAFGCLLIPLHCLLAPLRWALNLRHRQ